MVEFELDRCLKRLRARVQGEEEMYNYEDSELRNCVNKNEIQWKDAANKCIFQSNQQERQKRTK